MTKWALKGPVLKAGASQAVDLPLHFWKRLRVTNPPLAIFGENLRRLRAERGHTQEGFAYLAKLDRAFYGRIERGKQNVSLKTVWHLCSHLDIAPATLLSGITVEQCKQQSKDIDQGE